MCAYLLRLFSSLCRNDEIQSIRALKANDVNERVMKAKLEYKVRCLHNLMFL